MCSQQVDEKGEMHNINREVLERELFLKYTTDDQHHDSPKSVGGKSKLFLYDKFANVLNCYIILCRIYGELLIILTFMTLLLDSGTG